MASSSTRRLPVDADARDRRRGSPARRRAADDGGAAERHEPRRRAVRAAASRAPLTPSPPPPRPAVAGRVLVQPAAREAQRARPSRRRAAALWVTTTRVDAVLAVQLEQQFLHAARRSRDRGCRSARRRGAARGRRTSARATATRCCSPPESSPGRCAEPVAEADPLEQLAARARAPPSRGSRAISAGSMTFSSAVKSRQQVVELEDEADLPVAERGELAPRGCAKTSSPSNSTLPAVGRSSAPRRCSSVLFPTPDSPTIATRSPAPTSRSSPAEHRHHRAARRRSASRVPRPARAASPAPDIGGYSYRITSTGTRLAARRAG